jgi:transketolase
MFDEKKLIETANTIRERIIEMLVEAGSGHSAGPLGMADVFTALYFEILSIDPKNPGWSERDRLVLSCGHICPVWYATLAQRGYFPVSELKTLRKLGTRLQGHPHVGEPPGVENSGGPLGQGLSQAIGMALAADLDGSKWRVNCVMSDGEHDEGQTWEAIMFAGKNRLHNLTGWLDRNNIQIDGFTENVMPLEPLANKYESFGWHVLEVDGHNFREIVDAANEAKAIYEKPTVVICHTIPGKGVDFMENNYLWHGTPPGMQDIPGSPAKDKQGSEALKELRTLGGKIRSEHE